MKLYSSLSRGFRDLPAPPASVGLYVCGITPYDNPHLGHARAAVVFDAFVRFLRHRGNAVTYVRNVTDVDDKIIDRAQGGDIVAFTRPFIDAYRRMTEALGCLDPDHEPRVSGHIPEIRALVERLVARGYAYEAAGSVYFAVRSFPAYGELSGRNVDDLISGARVEPGEEKRDPLDFALWKAAKPGEPSWPSPWGAGRPGWHIECSAMSMKYLGETFEIHGGGNDLVFPHHENERAQSEAATGRPYALTWMHNGMITLENRKMSKSEGNTLSPSSLIDRHGSRTLRYYLLSVRYGSPLDVAEERLREARAALERFETFVVTGEGEPDAAARGVEAEFTASLEDDFNTAAAFSVLFEAVKTGNKGTQEERNALAGSIRRCGSILGLDLIPGAGHDEGDAEIDALVEERNRARRERDFARADEIRKALAARGITIEDSKEGTRWRR